MATRTRFAFGFSVAFTLIPSLAQADSDSFTALNFVFQDNRLFLGDGDWFPHDWKAECGGINNVLGGLSRHRLVDSSCFLFFAVIPCKTGNKQPFVFLRTSRSDRTRDTTSSSVTLTIGETPFWATGRLDTERENVGPTMLSPGSPRRPTKAATATIGTF